LYVVMHILHSFPTLRSSDLAYLMSHAFLETGHGTSALAKGMEVGKDKKGNLVRVTSSNRKNLSAIKKTYNMFGIGAVDSNPVNADRKSTRLNSSHDSTSYAV